MPPEAILNVPLPNRYEGPFRSSRIRPISLRAWFEAQRSLLRSVEMSGRLSNRNIREQVGSLWALTREPA